MVEEYESVSEELLKLHSMVKDLTHQAVVASGDAKEGRVADPETLRNVLLRLARVNSSLGKKAAKAKWVARWAEHAYKAAREQYKVDAIESGKTASYGDTQRYIKSTEEHKIWNDAQWLADESEDLRFTTDTFLKLGQSNLSIIRGDITRGNG